MNPSIATAAFIANTDFGGFSHFLHRAEPADQVDFWQPSPYGFRVYCGLSGGRGVLAYGGDESYERRGHVVRAWWALT